MADDPIGIYKGPFLPCAQKAVEWDPDNPPPRAVFVQWLAKRGRITEYPIQTDSPTWDWETAGD